MSEALQTTLELTRLELLDMGLRGNTLLNLRHTAATVPIIHESCSQVYRLLVLENRALRLLPTKDKPADQESESEQRLERVPDTLEEEPVQAALGDRSVTVPEQHTTVGADQIPASWSDLFLQTQLSEQALDRRLLKISNAARGYYEEQGVEILFLAIGCLHWSEGASGGSLRRAPLVLIPVELRRVAAGHGFKLAYTGADLGPNLTLASKLKSEFHLEMPDFEEDGFAITPYLASVKEAVASQKHWHVDPDDICLGFFSFGKFQMYQDLDPDTFVPGSKPWEHPLVRSLLSEGFGVPDSVSSPAPGLTELNFVKDSDTSQTQAALAVAQGSNLVIQGPPGTGKSQTITNIIAELLARGKKVLFVAEKMAALEVVKRRLDECHLGEAVLELHSHKSRRKAVLDELARCLDAGTPQTPDRSQTRSRHQQLQQSLDAYWRAVSTPVLQSGVDYVDALGEFLKLSSDVDLPSLGGMVDFEPMRDWQQADFVAAGHQVAALTAHLREHGSPDQSPWYGATLQQFSPQEQEATVALLTDLTCLLSEWQQQIELLSSTVGFDAPKNLAQAQRFVACSHWLKNAPATEILQGVRLETSIWQDTAVFDQIIVAGKQMQAIKTRRQAILLDQAWEQDVLALRGVWVATGDRWWRLVSGEFRQARRHLQGLLKGPLPADAHACVQILDDILHYQSLKAEFARVEQTVMVTDAHGHGLTPQQVLGSLWRGADSQWDKVQPIVHWLHLAATHVKCADLPEVFIAHVAILDESQRSVFFGNLDMLKRTVDDISRKVDALVGAVKMRVSDWHATQDGSLEFSLMSAWVTQANERIQDLYALGRFNLIEGGLQNGALRAIAIRARNWGDRPVSGLLRVLQASWYDGLVRHAYSTRPVIAQFDRASHEHAVAEFANLDKQLFVHAQERLVCDLHERLPSPMAVGEMAILRREMNKKRRHMALRQLIRVAGRAIQQIKPVFMMSPMSVATYLEHGAVDFDVVVFDEASQVRVADALGALLRAHQAVVVGDSKQMPPTDFFSRTLELDDEQAEQSQTADIESILGMFVAQGAPQKMLRWHYRSRHDSLIAVSNEAFYESKLLIFPTPGVHRLATGLKMQYLPQTHYDRGGSRTNLGEAQALAQAVMSHARTTPELSLGVVAFSTAQRDCLLLEIERLRRQNPALEAFFNVERPDGENFFVKNLENVQGDERDVILISIGYGRTQDGRLVPSFGPVNHEGGERRLNVLITRAKLAMEVFCNFTADDLRVDSTTPVGVRVLERFLRYASNGRLADDSMREQGNIRAFERYLCDEIRDLGYDPHPRLGQSGFYIDIAVQDPAITDDARTPMRYALALQTDGASYQTSSDARERERVRAGVLGAFGWQLYSVWSTDWLRSPEVERERLRIAIDDAVTRLYEQFSAGSDSTEHRSRDSAAVTHQTVPAQVSAKDVGGEQDPETPLADREVESTAQSLSDQSRPHDFSQKDDHQVGETEKSALSDEVAHATASSAHFLQEASITRLDPASQLKQAVPVYQPFEGSLGLPRHQSLHEALPESLSKSIQTLVSHEGPLHVDLIARRLADEAGVARLTTRVSDRIEQGIAYGVLREELFRHGQFIHTEREPQVEVRSRASLPAQYRNIDYVSPFELRSALRQTIGLSFGIKTDEAIAASLGLIGFQRVSAKSKALTKAVLSEMIERGEVESSRGALTLGANTG